MVAAPVADPAGEGGGSQGNDSLLWMAIALVLLVAALAGVLMLARGS